MLHASAAYVAPETGATSIAFGLLHFPCLRWKVPLLFLPDIYSSFPDHTRSVSSSSTVRYDLRT
jgi:hypothetical protein